MSSQRKHRHVTRRTWFRRTAGGAMASSVAMGRPGHVLGANDRIVLGFIGTGGMGQSHIEQFKGMPDVRIAAVCDVDRSRSERAATLAGSDVSAHGDFRELLNRKEIDAVVIATADHWHCLCALRAMEAGKDVYVEKPLGQNIAEGRVVADAAKRLRRITMIGTQQRSGRHWNNAVDRIRAGELGNVTMAHAWNVWNPHEMGGTLGDPPDSDPPAGVDYDMWLGPAPKRPFNANRFHFNYNFFWDFGSGLVNAWGVHLFDVVLWALGNRVRSATMEGGNFVHQDPRETPDTAQASFDCGDFTMTYSMRQGNGWRPHGDTDHGIEFFGTLATLQINRRGFQIYRETDRTGRRPFYREKAADDGWGDSLSRHKRNWLAAMRSRTETAANLESGHLSSIPGHLANIAYRIGRRVRWDAKTETILDDAEASKLLFREYRSPWKL